MANLVGRAELARTLGVSAKSIDRWGRQLPHEVLPSGQKRWDPEAVRCWLDATRGIPRGMGRPRGSGRGSIREHAGRWEARALADETGKRLTRRFRTYAEAAEWLERANRGATQDDPASETLDQLVERFLAAKRRRQRPGTVAFYTSHLTGEWTWTRQHRSMRVCQVKRRNLQTWVDERIDAGTSPGGVAAELRAIRALWSWARRDGAVQVDPAADVEGPAPSREARNQRILERHEIAAVIAVAEPPWRQAWMLMALLGCRADEVRRAHWQHVDLEGRRILVLGKRRDEWMPLPAWLAEELATLGVREGPLLVGRRGPLKSWQKTLNLACNSAGIDRVGVSPHALRHALMTWIDLMGCPSSVRLRIGRHAPRSVDERYLHAGDDVVREWLDRWADELRGTEMVRSLKGAR